MEQREIVHTAKTHCIVCGQETHSGLLCDCCRESLALCDVENYVARKTEGKICRPRPAQTLSNKTVLWYNKPRITFAGT